MDKITKLEIEIHNNNNGYVNINLTPESEQKLIKMDYTNSIILSHMFAQLAYNIMAKETVNEIDKLCEDFKSKATICDLFGVLAEVDDDEIQQISERAIQSGIDLVRHNMTKDAADIWQECLLGGLACLLSPNRNTNNKHYKYVMMLPTKPTKLNNDYVKYFEDILLNTRNYYPADTTAKDLEGYIVNILSLIIEKHIAEYSYVNKKIPDKEFFNNIQQHILKITTEALSVVISQLKDAYNESKIYNQLNGLTNLSPVEEAELTSGIDFRDILKAYRDNINNLKNKNEEDDDEENN